MDVCTTPDAVIEGGDGDCYSFAAATSALVNFDVSQSVPELTEPNGPMGTELAAALQWRALAVAPAGGTRFASRRVPALGTVARSS